MIELLRPVDKVAARASQGVCRLATFCVQSGNLAEAESLLREHIRTSLYDDTAFAMWSEHIRTSLNESPALAWLSELLGRQGRLPEATIMLQRAAAVLPANGEFKLGLSRLLDAQDQVQAALSQLNAIIGPVRHAFTVRAL